MLGKYFKVIEDFTPDPLCKDGGYLAAEKGDIVFEVEYVDDKYAQAKSMLTQRAGKIPRTCIQELQGEEDGKEKDEKDETDSVESTPEACNHEPREKSSNTEVSIPTSDTVAVSTAKSKSTNLTRPSPAQRNMGSFKKPELPKRPAPKCKRTNSMPVTSSFRSRASDEGYNSSSTYSGDKQGQPSKSSDDDCFVDTPLLQSQRARSASPPRHKMSVQDEDGYEVPMIVTKPGLKIQGEDTIDRRKPKLRFIFRKKLDIKNGSDPGGFDEGNGIFRMGCGPPSGFSSPSDSASPCQSPNRRRNMKKERLTVLSCVLVSLLIAMGLFLLSLIVVKLSTILSLAISTIFFSCCLVTPLCMARGRLLCIVSLLAPSLFAHHVKVALCVTMCAFLIVGPVFNISTNLDLLIRCSSVVIQDNTNHRVETKLPSPSQPAYQGSTATPRPQTPTKPTIISVPHKRAVGNVTSSQNLSDPKNASELLIYCKKSLHIVQQMCLSTQNVIEETCKSSRSAKGSLHHPSHCRINVDTICLSQQSITRACTQFIYTLNGKSDQLSKMQHKTAIIRRTILELLPILVLVLIFEAYYYTQGYLADKNQDNVYITGKLKVIDQERKDRGLKERMFPLRKLEFRRYCLPSSANLTAHEKRLVAIWLCISSIIGLFVLCLVLLDRSIHKAGMGHLEAMTGQVCARMQFTTVDSHLMKAIYVVLGILIGLSLLQGYVLRLRSRICASFYPRRETTRGVHLYYKVLQERAYFWKNCREKVRISAEARRLRWKTGVAHRIFAILPAVMRRGLTKLFVYRCMICGSHSCHRSFVCVDRSCSAVFCFECYIDMGESCISCQPSHQATFALSSPI